MSGASGGFLAFCTRCCDSIASDGFLLSCQHFVCASCAATCTSAQCPTCKDTSIDAVPLSDLPSDIGMYLNPPSQVLQMVGDVWTFQSNHYHMTIEHMRRSLKDAKQAVLTLQEQIIALKQEAANEREQRQRIEIECSSLREQARRNTTQSQKSFQENQNPLPQEFMFQRQQNQGKRDAVTPQRPRNVMGDLQSYFRRKSNLDSENKTIHGNSASQVTRPSNRGYEQENIAPHTGERENLTSSNRMHTPLTNPGVRTPTTRPQSLSTPIGATRNAQSASLASPSSRLRSPQLQYSRSSDSSRLRSAPPPVRPLSNNTISRPRTHGGTNYDSSESVNGELQRNLGSSVDSCAGLGMGAMRGIGAPQSRRPQDSSLGGRPKW